MFCCEWLTIRGCSPVSLDPDFAVWSVVVPSPEGLASTSLRSCSCTSSAAPDVEV